MEVAIPSGVLMLRTFSTFAATAGALLIASAASASAQAYPFSQRGRVEQTVAFTNVAVAYGRPFARGRMLFGDSAVVKWGRVWHPGADSATVISFSHDVMLEGRMEIKAGEYSLWLLPRESKPWTLILSRAARVFHAPYPGEASDAARIDVMPEHGAHMETLAFYFPVVLRDEALLRVHWGEMILPLRIKAPYRPDQ